MRLFSAKQFLAVDLGTHTVKVLVLTERKGRWRVEKLHTIQTGINAQTAPDQVLPRVGAALTALLKSAGLRNNECVGAIPGRFVFYRPLRIPSVPGERLDRIVRYEARQQIPFPLDQVIYDFHSFASGEDDIDVDVALVAAKKELINEYVDLMRGAGLSTEYLDVSSLALFNSFVSGHPGLVDQVVGVVDIGASTTDIVISSEGSLRFMRSAAVAGNHLTQSVAGTFAIPFDEAEQMKCRTFAQRDDGEGSVNLNVPGENRVAEAVYRGMEDIANEIRRSLDFFVSRPEGVPVSTLVLTGGTARIPGICEFLEERLGLDVMLEPGFTFEGLDTAAVQGDELLMTGVTLGLTLKVAEKAPVDMNFTPVTIRQTQAIRERRPSFLVEGVLVGIIIALLATNSMVNLRLEQEVLANVASLVGAGEQAEELRHAIQFQGSIQRRVDTLDDIAERRMFISSMWAELSRLKPDGVWVESVTSELSSMGIQGRSLRESDVHDFVVSLRISPFFELVRNTELQPDLNTQRYTIDVGQLIRPDPDAITFSNTIRRELDEGDVDIVSVNVDKSQGSGQVLYTHADLSVRNQELLHRAIARAVVGTAEAEGQAGTIRKVEVQALGLRREVWFAKEALFAELYDLHLGNISYDEYWDKVGERDVTSDVLGRRQREEERLAAEAAAAAQAAAAAAAGRAPAAPQGSLEDSIFD